MSRHVVIVGASGDAEYVEASAVADHLARRDAVLEAENDRIAAVMARGAVPDCCGPMIPEAPARGAFRVFEPHALYPGENGEWVAKPSGYRGRKAIESSDAFDAMEAQARKVLFSPAQKQMGRFYATLSERLAAVGARCSSLETMQGSSGGGGGEYIDAVIRDRERLTALHRRIGSTIAFEVRKVRPSQRNRCGLITDRTLVDEICLQRRTVSENLVRHGWAAPGCRPQGKHVKLLRRALCATLDRMTGPVGRNRTVMRCFET